MELQSERCQVNLVDNFGFRTSRIFFKINYWVYQTNSWDIYIYISFLYLYYNSDSVKKKTQMIQFVNKIIYYSNQYLGKKFHEKIGKTKNICTAWK